MLRMDRVLAPDLAGTSSEWSDPLWHAACMNAAAVSPVVGGQSYVCVGINTFTASRAHSLSLFECMCLYAEDTNI